MSIHTARLRALYLCAFVGLCLLAAGGRADADDGTSTPARAIPLARALPASFASYDALIATASAVANDQTTLYAQLLIVRAQDDTARSVLANVADPRLRGGLVRIEKNVSDETALAVPVRKSGPHKGRNPVGGQKLLDRAGELFGAETTHACRADLGFWTVPSVDDQELLRLISLQKAPG